MTRIKDRTRRQTARSSPQAPDAATHARRELPGGAQARIVAASGYREIPGAAREAGMDAYLVKPVKLSVLQQLLSEP